MNEYENNEFVPEQPSAESQYEAPPQSAAYHGAGTGRKESPYANSPYEMHHAPRQEYYYQPQTEPPVKPKKVKKSRKPMGKKILAAVLAVTLVAVSCIATGSIMTYRFNNMMRGMVESHAEEIHDLQEFRKVFIASRLINFFQCRIKLIWGCGEH